MEAPRRQIVLENPCLEEAYNAIRSGISRHKTVILTGTLSVDYDGRASSKLEAGERIAIFKPDGSALIHRPKDYSPVNWQPSGSLFNTKLNEDFLEVRIYRRKEREVMRVFFTDFSLVAILDLIDVGEFTLYATEKDMQEAILFKPELLEVGFKPKTREKAIDPGFIDILGVDKENILTVVEIKRNRASKEAVEQLKKYMNVIDLDQNRRVRGILVAPDLTKGASEQLKRYGFEFKALTPQAAAEVLKQKKGRPLTSYFRNKP
jgi:RecB family endonuclease NucS